MTVKLHTIDLSIGLDRNFRNQLIENFTAIQEALNGLIGSSNQEEPLTQENLTKQLSKITDRINRITLGIDEPTIEMIVEEKLKERGL